MRRAPALALALLLLPSLPTADAAGTVVPFSVLVDGQVAAGLLGLPASGQSSVLVVLAHGYGGSAASWRNVMLDLANRGYLSVAMDYRGAANAWKVTAGAADTIAATLAVQAAHPEVQRTILWGASMGGQVSGLAVMRGPPGLFDHWVDDVGVANWAESWAELPPFRAVMEREARGTPLEVPQVYVDKSPALNLTGFRGKGLARAFVLHASGDQAVPPSHGQQLGANLLAQGIPTTVYVVATAMQGRACAGAWQGLPNQCVDFPQALPAPVPHALTGYGVVLAKARGDPDLALPFAEGVYDVTTGVYAPAP